MVFIEDIPGTSIVVDERGVFRMAGTIVRIVGDNCQTKVVPVCGKTCQHLTISWYDGRLETIRA